MGAFKGSCAQFLRVLERKSRVGRRSARGRRARGLFPRAIIIIVGSRALRPPERIRQLMEFRRLDSFRDKKEHRLKQHRDGISVLEK